MKFIFAYKYLYIPLYIPLIHHSTHAAEAPRCSVAGLFWHYLY